MIPISISKILLISILTWSATACDQEPIDNSTNNLTSSPCDSICEIHQALGDPKKENFDLALDRANNGLGSFTNFKVMIRGGDYALKQAMAGTPGSISSVIIFYAKTGGTVTLAAVGQQITQDRTTIEWIAPAHSLRIVDQNHQPANWFVDESVTPNTFEDDLDCPDAALGLNGIFCGKKNRKKPSCGVAASLQAEAKSINKVCSTIEKKDDFRQCVAQCIINYTHTKARRTLSKYDSNQPVTYAPSIERYVERHGLNQGDEDSLIMALINFSKKNALSAFDADLYNGPLYRYDQRAPAQLTKKQGFFSPNPFFETIDDEGSVSIYNHVEPGSTGSDAWVSTSYDDNKELAGYLPGNHHCVLVDEQNKVVINKLKHALDPCSFSDDDFKVFHLFQYHRTQGKGARILKGGIEWEHEVVSLGFRPEFFRVVGYTNETNPQKPLVSKSDAPNPAETWEPISR